MHAFNNWFFKFQMKYGSTTRVDCHLNNVACNLYANRYITTFLYSITETTWHDHKTPFIRPIYLSVTSFLLSGLTLSTFVWSLSFCRSSTFKCMSSFKCLDTNKWVTTVHGAYESLQSRNVCLEVRFIITIFSQKTILWSNFKWHSSLFVVNLNPPIVIR